MSAHTSKLIIIKGTLLWSAHLYVLVVVLARVPDAHHAAEFAYRFQKVQERRRAAGMNNVIYSDCVSGEW